MTLDHSSQSSSPESASTEHPTATQQPTSVTHRPLTDAIQPITWLWPGRIPSGKLTLLDGSPNCGTTLFAVTLAAHISSGRPFPDGTACPQGNVLFIAPHDNFRDTLLPRLKAAGARDNHVIAISRVVDNPSPSGTASARTHRFSLTQDLPFLETLITQMQFVLLILDPYSAFPGWQRALPDLIDLAQRTQCAILLTHSLARPPADPLRPRVLVSPALTAARSHLLLAPDPRDDRHCLLLTPKHSLSAAPPTLSYTITPTDKDILTITWLPAPDPIQLHRLCTGPIRSLHRQAILQFLRECPNPRPIKEILHSTSYDYEAGRKMLVRMKMAGELVSPTSGLYTTADHPCLANISSNSSSSTSSSTVPVPNVPTEASTPNEAPGVMPARREQVLASIRAHVIASSHPPSPSSISTDVPCPDNHSSTAHSPTIPPLTLIPHPEKDTEPVPDVPGIPDVPNKSPLYQRDSLGT